MRRPLAAAHLARVIHMTSQGSLARAVAEKRVDVKSTGPDDELVLQPLRTLAKAEKLIEEEARALAQQRGWPTNIAGAAYGWTRLAGDTAREALPRIIRIFEREIFELDNDARETSGDEEVRSLVLGILDGRRSIHRSLSALDAQATLPGAK